MGSHTSAAPEAGHGERKESLFQLSEDLLTLDALLTESAGELTPEIETWLEEYAGKLASKVDSLGWFWRTVEARIAGFKKIEGDLTAKRRTEENKLARLKGYVQACMHNLGAKKLEGQVYSLGIQQNSARSFQLLEPYLSHPELLPEQFRRTVTRVEPDLEALKAATVEAGDTLQYVENDDPTRQVHSVAVLHPAGTHVRLR
jgi:hypothetical protein